MTRHRIFAMSFASIYPHYVVKAQRKDRSKEEVEQVISWLTGYDAPGLEAAIAAEVDLETFFAQAPRINPHAAHIKGVICGYRVEEIEDPLMRNIRALDKLVDGAVDPDARSWWSRPPDDPNAGRRCGQPSRPRPSPRRPQAAPSGGHVGRDTWSTQHFVYPGR